MSSAHNPTNFIDSVSSFADLELDIIIGSEGPSTSVLVGEARFIVKRVRDEVLATYKNKTIYVGVFLEALLDYAGKDIIPGYENITGERYTAGVIFAAYQHGKEKVKEIAEVWLQYMVIPMKTASNIRTPQPSVVESVTQKQLRNAVHQREGFRCLLHKYEILENAPQDAIDAYDPSRFRHLAVCHILPFSLNYSAENNSNTVGKLPIHWGMIKHWTAQSVQELVGEGINNPTNAILLCPHSRDDLRDFIIYFEPDMEAGRNCYTVKSPYETESVRFCHLNCAPSPDPRYLAIHRAFAKVLMATGAGDYVDSYVRDQKNIHFLASDGSTNASMILSKLRLIEIG